jgi:hypothetical protein
MQHNYVRMSDKLHDRYLSFYLQAQKFNLIYLLLLA